MKFQLPYVEILNKNTLQAFALIEPSECWFELCCFEVGEFEIYCLANKNSLQALKQGNYVKMPNKNYAWVITSVKYEYIDGKKMILASGKEAKWILSKRIIQKPIQLPNTLSAAIYKLFNDNVGSGAIASRKIDKFELQLINYDIVLEDNQAPRGNLLEFMMNLLKAYGFGMYCEIDNNVLVLKLINGTLKEEVLFSQSLDNLISSEYLLNEENVKTNVLVVSEVEDIEYEKEYDTGASGIDRSEELLESNISTKFTDVNGVEREVDPTSNIYQGWLLEEAKKELANHTTAVEVNGVIDLENSFYKFGEDYFIGDMVKIQDEYFDYSFTPRIIKYTIKQDAEGYGEEIEYGE